MRSTGSHNAQFTRRELLKVATGTVAAGSIVGSFAIGQTENGPATKPVPCLIDTHIHAVASKIPGLKPITEAAAGLYTAGPKAMAMELEKEMAAGGFRYALSMGSLDGGVTDPLGINDTLAICDILKGLRAVGIADPRKTDPAYLRMVETQLEKHRDKVVAFKAYLGYVPIGPEDPAYSPWYKLAEKYKLPVILHTGDNWSTKAKVKYAHPLRVDEVAVDFPNVQFIMAHMGNPWLIDAAEVMFKNSNVFADLS